MMPFPNSPLDVEFEIAPGADLTADPGTWPFTSMTSKVRTAGGVDSDAGRQAGATRGDPQKATIIGDNRSGDLSRKNPNGIWYGKLNRNTPLRIRIRRVLDGFDNRTTTSGFGTCPSGQTWSLSGGNAVDYTISGGLARVSLTTVNSSRQAFVNCSLRDVEVTGTLTVPVTPTGAAMNVGVTARRVDGSNYYLARAIINTTGSVDIRLIKVFGGTTTLATTTAVLTHTPGKKLKIKFSVVGSLLDAKVWDADLAEPVGWQVSYSDPAPLDVPGAAGIHLIASTGLTNTLPFTVTLDDFAVRVDRVNGFIPNLPPRWDKSGKDATAPIAISGMLRRLGQGKSPIQTPMAAAIAADKPVAWWTLEDGPDATFGASAVSGGSPMEVSLAVRGGPAPKAVFSGFPGPAGSGDLVDIKTNTALVGKVSGTTAAGWRIELISQLDTTTYGDIMLVHCEGGSPFILFGPQPSIAGFAWSQTLGSAYLEDTSIPYAVGISTWTHIVVTAQQIGPGNVRLQMWLNGVYSGFADTGAGSGTTLTPITRIVVSGNGATTGGIGHIAVFNTLTPSIGAQAMTGHLGEPAGQRIQRLCGQYGVRYTISGQEANTARMGAQPKDLTLVEQLRLCEDTDQGVLYERGYGLAYQTRVSRYNRPVDLALPAGALGEAPEPADDDQRLRNQWTIKNIGGSTITVSTNSDDPVAGEKAIGIIDSSVDVNLDAGQEDQNAHGYWRLRQSTLDDLRWDALDLNLRARPDLVDAWLSLRLGSRITAVVSMPQLPASNPDVLVDGFAEHFGPYDWTVKLACTPAAGYVVGVLDSATYGHIGMDLCVLAGSGWNGAAGTFQVTSTGALWTTTGANYPVDLEIGGQVVRVSGCAGAGNPQTFTVLTASVNGIVKNHPAGTPVRLLTPLYVAL